VVRLPLRATPAQPSHTSPPSTLAATLSATSLVEHCLEPSQVTPCSNVVLIVVSLLLTVSQVQVTPGATTWVMTVSPLTSPPTHMSHTRVVKLVTGGGFWLHHQRRDTLRSYTAIPLSYLLTGFQRQYSYSENYSRIIIKYSHRGNIK